MSSKNLSSLEGNDTLDIIYEPIAYSTYWEMVLLVMYNSIAMVFICSAHLVVMITISKEPRVQNPHNFIIAAYSLMDFLLNFPGNAFMIMGTFLVNRVPDILCRLFAPFAIGSFFTMCLLVGLMAFERYSYFIHPLTYPRHFSHRNTFLMIGAICLFTGGYSVITEILIGRVYHTSILFCHLPGTVILNYIQIAVFFVPSLIISTFSMIKIWNLTRSHRVAPADEGAAGGVKVPSMRIALKVLMLVSGIFWGSYVPGFVLRTVLFSSGYTWKDMDTRRDLWSSIGIRISNIILTHWSSAANPIIYYMINKDLRIAMRRTLGLKQKAGDVENTTYTETTVT